MINNKKPFHGVPKYGVSIGESRGKTTKTIKNNRNLFFFCIIFPILFFMHWNNQKKMENRIELGKNFHGW